MSTTVKTNNILATLTEDQRRAFDWLRSGVPAAQKKVREQHLRRSLAELARLEKWSLPTRR